MATFIFKTMNGVMKKDKLLFSSNKEILDKVQGLAYQNERVFHGCAQSLLAAVQNAFGVADDNLFKSANGLAGGIGISTMGTCGALIGG